MGHELVVLDLGSARDEKLLVACRHHRGAVSWHICHGTKAPDAYAACHCEQVQMTDALFG